MYEYRLLLLFSKIKAELKPRNFFYVIQLPLAASTTKQDGLLDIFKANDVVTTTSEALFSIFQFFQLHSANSSGPTWKLQVRCSLASLRLVIKMIMERMLIPTNFDGGHHHHPVKGDHVSGYAETVANETVQWRSACGLVRVGDWGQSRRDRPDHFAQKADTGTFF